MYLLASVAVALEVLEGLPIRTGMLECSILPASIRRSIP